MSRMPDYTERGKLQRRYPKGLRVAINVPTMHPGEPRQGVVVGHSLDGRCVRVVADGRLEPQAIHHTFLKRQRLARLEVEDA